MTVIEQSVGLKVEHTIKLDSNKLDPVFMCI